VKLAGLAPGNFRLEGWGPPEAGGTSSLYFTRDVAL
jgi:hypothetical protein